MKEFLAGFQVDTENKELAGVCAGLGNYFNIKTIVVRLVMLFLFLSSTEFGILTVTLYAYLAVCLILVSLGTEGLTAIYESGKAFGQWLVGLV